MADVANYSFARALAECATCSDHDGSVSVGDGHSDRPIAIEIDNARQLLSFVVELERGQVVPAVRADDTVEGEIDRANQAAAGT